MDFFAIMMGPTEAAATRSPEAPYYQQASAPFFRRRPKVSPEALQFFMNPVDPGKQPEVQPAVGGTEAPAQPVVDFDFIRKQEGFEVKGYIPRRDGKIMGQSGVTIGSGVDLGQQDEKSLAAAGVPPELIAKVRPYFGLRREAAADKLAKSPLELSEDEAEQITQAMKGRTVDEIRRRYDQETREGAFDSLPKSIQTVIASVAFQYGTNLGAKNATPNFWRQVLDQDWAAVVKNLRNFGDRHEKRRNREADLIESELGQLA